MAYTESVSLDMFLDEERKRIAAFEAFYRKQNELNPGHYPLELPSDNAGAWDEMLSGFDA